MFFNFFPNPCIFFSFFLICAYFWIFSRSMHVLKKHSRSVHILKKIPDLCILLKKLSLFWRKNIPDPCIFCELQADGQCFPASLPALVGPARWVKLFFLENFCQFPHFSPFNKIFQKDFQFHIDLGCIKGQNCVLYSPNLIT